MKLTVLAFACFLPAAWAQIANLSVSTASRQALLQYTPPISGACSLRVADMNRGISISGSTAASDNSITIQTQSPHGLRAGAVVYVEGTGTLDGWQTVTAVPSSNQFSISGDPSAAPASGAIGVLIDDVNPVLFPGSDLDSRPGNTVSSPPASGRTSPSSVRQLTKIGSSGSTGQLRTFVLGRRTADIASDGNRYSRALQVNSRHHYSLTCGMQTLDGDFNTANLPLGETYNDGLPLDRAHPGQYAYPTVQWANKAQALIDPLTGVRSFRATGPAGTPSAAQNFQTAWDLTETWKNPAGPLAANGTATFQGPCTAGGNCPLFLRADGLSIPGGATYASNGSSLDWLTVTISGASINNGSCQGDDCTISACLTVDGVSCATGFRKTSLSTTAKTYTLGTTAPMDLWQNGGPPPVSRVDASQATGVVNYTAATKRVTVVSGKPFNIRWGHGSRITIAGTEYVIDSIQNENTLTLLSGPDGDANGAAYTANNFGVLLWKTTAAPDVITLGKTQFAYGSSPFTGWFAESLNVCGPAVTVNGTRGYNCFLDNDLYWTAEDGSESRDLGTVAMSYGNGRFSAGAICGNNQTLSPFDPADGDTWYCLKSIYFDANRISLIKVQYRGPHTAFSGSLPDCSLNHGTQPCLDFTILQPNPSDSLTITALGFSPDFAASGFKIGYWFFGGVSQDGDVLIYVWGQSQDTPGWQFVVSLGDRTPAGTTPDSVRVVAAASTYRKAPLSWCVLHDAFPPQGGWVSTACNDILGSPFVMTLMSTALSGKPGADGGLNPCPGNVLGVAGDVCTEVVVSGDPLRVSDGSFLQTAEVGDLVAIDSEFLRIIAKTDSTHLTLQRGYAGSTPAAHTSKQLKMTCGVVNQFNARLSTWNYRADPTGANPTWTTVIPDPGATNTHANWGNNSTGTYIEGGGNASTVGDALCPAAIVGRNGGCYIVRNGGLGSLSTAPAVTVAGNPPFAGKLGIGSPLQIDGHPGPCMNGVCIDAHPFDGGTSPFPTVGTPSAPFVNTSGQLWKGTGGAVLNRKHLATMAFVGRTPLVDVSGAGTTLSDGAGDSYKYCIANKAGECRPGSAAGDVYVNAPYVSFPYCAYPGIAKQSDDTNSICIGDLGLPTGNVIEMGVLQPDFTGSSERRLGPAYTRWNQQDVYWNVQAPVSGTLLFSQVRWMEGVRSDDLVTILPPYPAADGVARNTFQPLAVAVPAPTVAGADNAVLEFGYAENGDPGQFYCTSRQEGCVATGASFDGTAPFFYTLSEAYQGTPCAAGCTIAIPALPQRVVYYRWKYRDASGAPISAGPLQVRISE